MKNDEGHTDSDPHPDREHEAGREARRDDYLWDRTGVPDPTVSKLEGALAQRRWRGRLPDLAELDAAVDEGHADVPGPAPGARPRALLLPRALAAALIVFLLTAVGLSVWSAIMEPHGGEAPVAQGPEAPDVPDVGASGGLPATGAPLFHLHAIDGTPRLDGVGVRAGAEDPLAMGPGAALETDARSRARVFVGAIGSVELGTDSRLRVGDAAEAGDPEAGFLLHLDRGSLTASIFAAPRLFQLGTPSGIAVDMGCIYTAHVDDDGTTRLHVELGQVSFETEGRKVLVPSGAGTRAWPGSGPGTPVWDDAPERWREAVERYDELARRGEDDASRAAAFETVLATERPEDSLTLWHLLARVDGGHGEEGARVYARLAALEPPPEGVTRAACLAGDRDALLAWRDVMGWAWATGAAKAPGR